tara:strand:+ start:198 stop:1397 length:1200 start_codon:yes stop_codon:yes gene_type:complete
MPNIQIKTNPTGRSPENKYFFGNRSIAVDLSRPQYNRIGKEKDFIDFKDQLDALEYAHVLNFETCGIKFCVKTNDSRHAQFVCNMFTITSIDRVDADWIIVHNTDVELNSPKIYVHLDKKTLLIGGTTFLGEIKKGVFTVVNFELPQRGVFPMHCSAFTHGETVNLMFGLSGTGKTTLSSDPQFRLIGDDEIAWGEHGVEMIESGCYAKSEGLSLETHETIYKAIQEASNKNCLVEENPNTPNGRLSYPITCVNNSYSKKDKLGHANNIFFLTMDAEGKFPAISKISGETVRRFFETGYTSQMPHTEKGVDEIKRICSPCYGSPFMPLSVKAYSDLLMQRVEDNNCNVFLVNTGMDTNGKRFALEYTRKCVRDAIDSNTPSVDSSKEVSDILEECLKDV